MLLISQRLSANWYIPLKQVRNATGAVGLVPESYVQLGNGSSETALPPPPPPPASVPVQDIAMADAWGPPVLDITTTENIDQHNSSVYSAADYEVQAALSAPTVPNGKICLF